MGKKPMRLCIVTIVSGNYLAYAKVLSNSVKIHMPDADFSVLVVDRPSATIDLVAKQSGLHVTYAIELEIPDIERIAYKYDIVELNTALKPTFIKRMFAEGYSHVIYLDPDIQVFAPLVPVLDAMNEASITLIPHTLRPVLDGKRPSDVDFLQAGAFNLGFIALRDSEQTYDMLNWWESRCLGLGFNDLVFGTFVDQKWIDLVPSYFDSVKILRHIGCNVAYWNLHEREINWLGSHYTVNGESLVFFHFSGVKVDNPTELSKYQTRHKLSTETPLARLVAEYCQQLLDADHVTLSKLPYSFSVLDDGTLITPVMRRALCCVSEHEKSPFATSSPFQRRLLKLRITPHDKKPQGFKNISKLNFDQTQLRVQVVNIMVRLCTKILGINKFYMLLRYAALLTSESHYPAVLMKELLRFEHLLKR